MNNGNLEGTSGHRVIEPGNSKERQRPALAVTSSLARWLDDPISLVFQFFHRLHILRAVVEQRFGEVGFGHGAGCNVGELFDYAILARALLGHAFNFIEKRRAVVNARLNVLELEREFLFGAGGPAPGAVGRLSLRTLRFGRRAA